MTYCEDLDPNSRYSVTRDEWVDFWDMMRPEWREMTTEPEDRVLVDYNDVKDPMGEGIIRYGSDHARLIPAAY